jgi:hypothetical protein
MNPLIMYSKLITFPLRSFGFLSVFESSWLRTLNTLAESHVPERQRKENQNQRDKDDVEHVSDLPHYQAPSLRPIHQMTPTVAVFCSDLRTPGTSVKKNSWLEKSRLHSPRIKKPSPSLKSAVSVVSFKA